MNLNLERWMSKSSNRGGKRQANGYRRQTDLKQLTRGVFRSTKSAPKRSVAETIADERRNLLSPKSEFFVREAYKTLRTNVSFSLTNEEKCHVIVTTSSMQGEGKSITTMNLAISYAQTDRKVLVVDCDLRRPKLARLMQMNSTVGLSNLILNPKLLSNAILPTHVPGLDVILAGDIPPNPSELLGSPRMERIVSLLREKYDFIFLDSPPVNMVTDAVVLAPLSDGVIFLVRANRSERGAVIHAVEQLEYAKAKILGFVLNDVDMEKTHYGYGHRYKSYSRYRRYGYGYGYGYGYSSRSSQYTEQPMEEELRPAEQQPEQPKAPRKTTASSRAKAAEEETPAPKKAARKTPEKETAVEEKEENV